MQSMRESWTDERLDDLTERVGSGFERIDTDLRGLRMETRSEFVAVRTEMKAGFDRVDERIEALHRLLVQSVVVLFAALVGLHFV